MYYTNELPIDFTKNHRTSIFTEEQRLTFCMEALAILESRDAYERDHPVIGIYRLAVEGSQTRDGGVITAGSSTMKIRLANGEFANVAKVGDWVVYGDGSKTRITTGGGIKFDGAALVGSQCCNSDEIINTPQNCGCLLVRRNVAIPEDFLPHRQHPNL